MGICKHCGMYMKPFDNGNCEFCGEKWYEEPTKKDQCHNDIKYGEHTHSSTGKCTPK